MSYWPCNLFFAKYLINGVPIKKIIVRDVITDKPILKVIYLNTFKKEKVSIMKLKDYKAFNCASQ